MKTLARHVLVLAIALLWQQGTRADDWPTYRHDPQRSGRTEESLPLPLSGRWRFRPRYAPEPAWVPPKSVPIEGILERRRVHFDDAFHVAVAGAARSSGSRPMAA